MFDEQRVYEFGGLLAAGYGLYQARKIHDVELEKSRQRHQESIELAKKQHENDMKTVKQTYLLELFNSLEQHFQQLNADLIASSRESERDMFDQRNQSFQTIILASSVMFSALASIIVDGNLPVNSGKFLLVAYSLTCSLSFSFLFLSIVFCIELVIRTSSFMYKRGKSHTKSLRKAINDTKGMMRDLRGESRGHSHSGGLHESESEAQFTNLASTSGIAGESNNLRSIRRAISRMQPNEIEAEFERHEAEIRGYLKKRETLNDSAALTSYRDEVTGVKRPFKHFWEESCESWWSMAILLFYGGSLNMLLALMIFMWAQFYIFYNSIVAAIIGVSMLGLILIIGIGTVIVMRKVDRKCERRELQELSDLGVGPVPVDETGRADASGSTAVYGNGDISGESRWSSRIRLPMPFARRHNSINSIDAQEAPESIAENGHLSRGSSPPVAVPRYSAVPVFHTDSTKSLTSTPTTSASVRGGDRVGAGIQPIESSSTRSTAGRGMATPPHLTPNSRSHSTDPRHGSLRRSWSAPTPSPSTRYRPMRDLPPLVETNFEEAEAGSVADSSVNSSLTIPPGAQAAQHIFQEEPSPRRKFLSGFGSSQKKSTKSQSPSLYMSALRRTANSELNRHSLEEIATPSGDSFSHRTHTSSSSPAHPMHSFHFPSALPGLGRSPSTSGTPRQDSGGSGSERRPPPHSSGRSAQAPVIVDKMESDSNLSNMSGSGGGISF